MKIQPELATLPRPNFLSKTDTQLSAKISGVRSGTESNRLGQPSRGN